MPHAMDTLTIAAWIQSMKSGLFRHSPCNALCVGVGGRQELSQEDSGGHPAEGLFCPAADTLS